MVRQIENLGQKILYEAPTAFSLLFVGAATYMSEGDPAVREQLEKPKDQLRHWGMLYNWGVKVMPTLVVAGTISALAAYRQSQEKMWLVGAGVLTSGLLYTMLVMGRTYQLLHTLVKESK